MTKINTTEAAIAAVESAPKKLQFIPAVLVAAKMLHPINPMPAKVHPDLVEYIKCHEAFCNNAGARLLSEQVVAVIVYRWLETHVGEVPYED